MGEPGALARWAPLVAPVARRALALGAVALVASWLGFYLITPWPGIALKVFRATVLLHIVTAAVVIPYLVSLVLRRKLPGGGVLDIPILAALGAYLLATAASENWRVSLENALFLLMAVSVFFVLSDSGLFRRWQVEAALVLAALATALRALWVVGGDYLDWLRLSRTVHGEISWGDLIPPTVPRVTDVSDHANLLGMVLAMALPFFLVAVFRRVTPYVRMFALAGTAVIALALFLTLSRGAWLGAAAATGVTFIAAPLLLPSSRDAFKRIWGMLPPRGRWLVVPAAAATVAAAAIVVIFLIASSNSRPDWLFRESASTRWDVVTAGAEMVRDYPVLGTGPDTFSLLYPEYSGENPRFNFHSHNGFLQTAVDAGIPGVGAMVLLAGALGWLLVKAIPAASPETRLTLIAVGASLTAFATHSLFDAPNTSKAVLVMLAAVVAVGVLSRQETRSETAPTRAKPVVVRGGTLAHLGVRCLIPIAMAGLLITWARLDVGHYYYSSAVANANSQRWPQALEHAERAVELDPEFAIYRLELATIHGQAFLDTRELSHLDNAMTQFERTLELEPRSAIAHANMALLQAEVAEPQAAREAALAALEMDNSDPAVAMVAGAALEKSNWGQAAIDAYARAVSLDSSLADSPYWNDNPFRKRRYEDIIGRSTLAYNPCRLLGMGADDGAASAGRVDTFSRCADRVQTNPGDMGGRVAMANALIDAAELFIEEEDLAEASAPLIEAKAHLDFVATRQPDNGPARTALGRWYAARGDLDAARTQWLRAGELGQVEALVLLGDSYLPGRVPPEVAQKLRSEMGNVRSEVQFHLIGILYYRRSFYRESPWTILLPGEWQGAVPGDLARAQDALERWTGGPSTSLSSP